MKCSEFYFHFSVIFLHCSPAKDLLFDFELGIFFIFNITYRQGNYKDFDVAFSLVSCQVFCFSTTVALKYLLCAGRAR